MFDRLRTRLDAGRQDGFTLIELLIVIVILGILAGIVVFAVGTARDDSVQASCDADAKSVRVATEALKAQTGDTTPTWDELVDEYLKENPNTGNSEYSVSLAGVCTVL